MILTKLQTLKWFLANLLIKKEIYLTKQEESVCFELLDYGTQIR
jgi:hypothetical protein